MNVVYKNRHIAIGVLVLAVTFGSLGYGGWWYFKKPDPQKNKVVQQSAPVSDTPSSLSVSQDGGSIDLGQIPLNGVEGSQKQSNGNSSSSNSSNQLNPATFKEYEKYKDGKSALFGEIIKGEGAEVAANKKAIIAYRGWLTDGTLFDSSKKDADGKYQPIAFIFGNNEVIPGMEQGISGMKVGGTRLVIVPPAVGYGAQGKDTVPPNAIMVFEVGLVDVQ